MQHLLRRYGLLIGLAGVTILLLQCGRKNSDYAATIPSMAPYAPDGWNGQEDWPGNALQVQDLQP